MTTASKFVYLFGSARTEGAAAMKNLLGGKGANLAEMCLLGITVPSGFTISTEACTTFTEHGKAAALKLISASTRGHPKRLANIADRILASSSLVSAR